MDTCSKKLTDKRVRQTETRRVLLALLHEADTPLSPPEIVKRCHALGRRANKTTIYRDLVLLEQAGVVHKVMLSDQLQYFELTEHSHHHHFICTVCNKITDVEMNEASLLIRAEQLGKELGFQITTHAVEFYGQCFACG